MNSQVEREPLAIGNPETVVHPATHSVAATMGSSSKQESAQRSWSQLGKKTLAILQLRLRAAAILLFVGLALYLLPQGLGGYWGSPPDFVLVSAAVLTMLGLGLNAIRLQ